MSPVIETKQWLSTQARYLIEFGPDTSAAAGKVRITFWRDPTFGQFYELDIPDFFRFAGDVATAREQINDAIDQS